MSIKEIKNMQSEKGFTIVELLIVIVVIGILAAIVVVAFNGVQNQATAKQRQTDAQSIAKLAEAYNADENNTGYPQTAANINSYTMVKLPSNVSVNTTAFTVPTTPTAANVGPSTTGGNRVYNVRFCGGTSATGVVIYYWDPSTSSMKTSVAGASC